MKYYRPALIFCILLFASLSLLHYFSQRPLWLDENFIFDNIKNHGTAEILGPLQHCQAFPRMYLVALSRFSAGFDYNVLALRFFPLLSMFAAFFVWLRLYYREIPDGREALLASFSMACSYYFSYYAAELKQYSMDVLVVGIFCLYLINQERLISKKPSWAFFLATLLLPLTLLLSYGAFFVFWIVIYNFLFIPKKSPGVWVVSAAYALLCLLCAIFVYYFDMKHTLSTEAFFSYWDSYFISTDSFLSFVSSFSEGFRKLTVLWFGKDKIFVRFGSVLIPFFALPLFIYGVSRLRQDRFMIRKIDSLGLVIFLELFILGILKKYPFTGGRITLFFAPFVFYFIIKGIGYFKADRLLYASLNIYYITFLSACSLSSFICYFRMYWNK